MDSSSTVFIVQDCILERKLKVRFKIGVAKVISRKACIQDQTRLQGPLPKQLIGSVLQAVSHQVSVGERKEDSALASNRLRTKDVRN